MRLADLERELKQSAGALLCDPRVIRRVIKHHRNVTGLVPHGRCYALSRTDLAELTTADELGFPLAELPDDVVLVARPSPREIGIRLQTDTATRIWRLVFHARIHRALEVRVDRGELDEAAIRQRIATIGQTEFDEIRAILRHDDRVMPPGDDREVYIEFAALYLELKHFAPSLLVTTFPGVTEHDRVREALDQDVDVAPLLERGRPGHVASPASTKQLAKTSMPSFSAPATFNDAPAKVRPITPRAHRRLLDKAKKARDRGNDVRAALLCAQATHIEDRALAKEAQTAERDALVHLGGRLSAALAKPGERERSRDWSLLLILGSRAAEERAVRYSVEARLLYLLQTAAIAHERPHTTVELSTWILSLGKRDIVRELPVAGAVRIARLMQTALKRVRNVRIGDADRKLLSRLLGWAASRAEDNLREVLRPRILEAFDEVGLTPLSGPELLARGKVCEELIDYILARGYLTFDILRDALSRNQLKLDDLSHARTLWNGDALVKADAELAVALDGIYRRGDIYVRGLQKVSSLPFGTKVGRVITLFGILPLGASYVVLEGLTHFVNPVLGWFGQAPVPLLNWTSFGIVALVIFALIHSKPFRAVARQVLDVIAWILATVFFRVPRAILSSGFVRRFFARPTVRFALRRVILPAGIGVAAFYLAPFEAWYFNGMLAMGIIAGTSVLLGSSIGALLEDFVVDQLAPTWQVISRQWLPGLLRLISRFFSRMMELMQRSFVRVDELLRFRRGQSSVMLVFKGALGFVWGIVSYVIRLYVTLLIEPEINPLKHFPVVTVAHKLMIVYLKDALIIFTALFAPLGTVAANTIAGVTVFLLPSVFGFLAWELKENYKLYRATRPDRLIPSPVGPHGETMGGLLVVGLHSGTLPKLYERLRRAAQREDEALVLNARPQNRAHALGGLGRFRDGLREIEQGVRRFVERELIAVLHRSPRWSSGELSVESVDLSSNRIRVSIGCTEFPDQCAEIRFEEQSGHVVAGAAQAGFIPLLEQPQQAMLFENALGGLYQLAEVDLVREQVEAELGPTAHYDIADDGLVVWPQQDYKTELIYPIHKQSKKAVAPKVRGEPPEVPPAVIDTARMSFQNQAISWIAWVAAWTATEREGARIPRLLQGSTILPAEPSAPARSTGNAQAAAPFMAMPATVPATPIDSAAVTRRVAEVEPNTIQRPAHKQVDVGRTVEMTQIAGLTTTPDAPAATTRSHVAMTLPMNPDDESRPPDDH